MGLALFFATTLLGMPPLALGLALVVLGESPDRSREALHLILAGMYVGWMLMPILGYRLNESLDVSKLFHYPVSYLSLFFTNFVGSALDVSALLILPTLVVLAVAHGDGPWGVLPPLAIVSVFLLHTMSVAQFMIFFLRHLLRHRRFWDALMVLLPLGAIAVFWGGQALSMTVSLGDLEATSPLDVPWSRFLAFFPPGLAAEALAACRAGDAAGALYWGLTLAACAAVTLLVAGFLCVRMLSGHYDRAGAARARAPGPRREYLYPLLARLLPRPVAAVAAREATLVLREPQYRMVLGLYLLMFAVVLGAVWVGQRHGDVNLAPAVEALLVSSVFFFGSLMFNNLAIERGGFKLTLAAPLSGRGILAAKNLGVLLVLAGCCAATCTASLLVLGPRPDLLVVNFTTCLVLALVTQGLGNLVSVLCPIPLPEAGLTQRRRIGMGRIAVMSLLTMLVLSASLAAAAPPTLLLAFAVAAQAPLLLGPLVPLSLLYALGLWGLATLLASTVFERRREELVPEVVD